MKGKLVTILFIIVFILLVAVIISLLTDDQGVTNINDIRLDTVQTDTPVLADVTTPPPVQETVAPTMLPLPTPEPTPVPTPEPTPVPTPTPPPMITDLGAGSFRSNINNKINIVSEWSVTALNETHVNVDVTVYVESYSLHLDPARSVNVSLAGQFVTLDAPAIVYDGSALMLNELASTSFTIELPVGYSNSYTLAVEWQFGGTYFNQAVPVIECGGTINIVR